MRLRNGSLVSPLLFGWNAPKGLSNHLIYCCSAIALKFTFSHALLSLQTFISLFSSLRQGIVESWWRTEWAFYQCWISTGNKLVSSMERKREKEGLQAIGRNRDSSKQRFIEISTYRNYKCVKEKGLLSTILSCFKCFVVEHFCHFVLDAQSKLPLSFWRPSWPCLWKIFDQTKKHQRIVNKSLDIPTTLRQNSVDQS